MVDDLKDGWREGEEDDALGAVYGEEGGKLSRGCFGVFVGSRCVMKIDGSSDVILIIRSGGRGGVRHDIENRKLGMQGGYIGVQSFSSRLDLCVQITSAVSTLRHDPPHYQTFSITRPVHLFPQLDCPTYASTALEQPLDRQQSCHHC